MPLYSTCWITAFYPWLPQIRVLIYILASSILHPPFCPPSCFHDGLETSERNCWGWSKTVVRGLHQRGNILYTRFSWSRSVFHWHLSIHLLHFSPLNFLHFIFQGLDPDTSFLEVAYQLYWRREEKKKSKVLTTFSSLFCYSVVLFSSFSANFISKFAKAHFQDGHLHFPYVDHREYFTLVCWVDFNATKWPYWPTIWSTGPKSYNTWYRDIHLWKSIQWSINDFAQHCFTLSIFFSVPRVMEVQRRGLSWSLVRSTPRSWRIGRPTTLWG